MPVRHQLLTFIQGRFRYGSGMNMLQATRDYEHWLSRQTPLIKVDLLLKHKAMREDLFPFLRATYYRWAQTWPSACPELARDHMVLAVGDLHVDNFGTWRDIDARLVWGVNDFDECHPLPFSNDLVRVATSAYVAKLAGEMEIAPKAAAMAILDGYRDCLRAVGRPFVLANRDTPLRAMVRDRLKTPEKFWQKLLAHPPAHRPVPPDMIRPLQELLPARGLPLKFVHRIAGLGNLGKERFTGLGEWMGGKIAREGKALTSSACQWAAGFKKTDRIHYAEILKRAVRCPDPLFKVSGKWLLRRLSPDCFRVELSNLPKRRDEKALLYSMGWETANIHLGSADAGKLLRALKEKRKGWLHKAAKAMREQTIRDWKAWRKT